MPDITLCVTENCKSSVDCAIHKSNVEVNVSSSWQSYANFGHEDALSCKYYESIRLGAKVAKRRRKGLKWYSEV